VDDIQQGGANENIITATWSNEINSDELEEHENLAGPNHNLPYGSSEKDFFDLYVGRDFCELVTTETISSGKAYKMGYQGMGYC
jgi:hypothetical protein